MTNLKFNIIEDFDQSGNAGFRVICDSFSDDVLFAQKRFAEERVNLLKNDATHISERAGFFGRKPESFELGGAISSGFREFCFGLLQK